jgi:hypothetical protein
MCRSAGSARLFKNGAKLTNKASGALILAMPIGDRRCCIYKLQRAQRPMKLFAPGFASWPHSYDEEMTFGLQTSCIPIAVPLSKIVHEISLFVVNIVSELLLRSKSWYSVCPLWASVRANAIGISTKYELYLYPFPPIRTSLTAHSAQPLRGLHPDLLIPTHCFDQGESS